MDRPVGKFTPAEQVCFNCIMPECEWQETSNQLCKLQKAVTKPLASFAAINLRLEYQLRLNRASPKHATNRSIA